MRESRTLLRYKTSMLRSAMSYNFFFEKSLPPQCRYTKLQAFSRAWYLMSHSYDILPYKVPSSLTFPESGSSPTPTFYFITWKVASVLYTPSTHLKTRRYLHCLVEVQGKSRFVGPQCLHLWCRCSFGHFFWSLQGERDSGGWSYPGFFLKEKQSPRIHFTFI